MPKHCLYEEQVAVRRCVYRGMKNFMLILLTESSLVSKGTILSWHGMLEYLLQGMG
jgi:hypothetical protein